MKLKSSLWAEPQVATNRFGGAIWLHLFDCCVTHCELGFKGISRWWMDVQWMDNIIPKIRVMYRHLFSSCSKILDGISLFKACQYFCSNLLQNSSKLADNDKKTIKASKVWWLTGSAILPLWPRFANAGTRITGLQMHTHQRANYTLHKVCDALTVLSDIANAH